MISERWIKKYMRMARFVGEDDNRCYSRKIGVVIVNSKANRVLSVGLNGPPRGTPACDSREYLERAFLPQLSGTDISTALEKLGIRSLDEGILTTRESFKYKDEFLDKASNCGQCPRKLIGAASGQRMEGCSCAHGEANAIVNAGCDLQGSVAFCWCGVPCFECCKLIINAKLSKIYCIDWEIDYSYGSRFLLEKGDVKLEIHPAQYYLS